MKTIDISKLKPNDILVCVGDSALANAILKATNGKFSHTAQVVKVNGKLMIFDAQEGGCMVRSFEFWKQEFNYDFRVFRNPKENVNDFSDWFLQFSGRKYDKKGLAIGLGKSLFKNLFKINSKMKEKYRNNGLFWCSELTMKPYVNNPEQYAPQNVYEWLIENKWVEIN
jgi:hypothetical protein